MMVEELVGKKVIIKNYISEYRKGIYEKYNMLKDDDYITLILEDRSEVKLAASCTNTTSCTNDEMGFLYIKRDKIDIK